MTIILFTTRLNFQYTKRLRASDDATFYKVPFLTRNGTKYYPLE